LHHLHTDGEAGSPDRSDELVDLGAIGRLGALMVAVSGREQRGVVERQHGELRLRRLRDPRGVIEDARRDWRQIDRREDLPDEARARAVLADDQDWARRGSKKSAGDASEYDARYASSIMARDDDQVGLSVLSLFRELARR